MTDDREYNSRDGWQNGNITRILSTVMALLLVGAIGTGAVAINQLSGVKEQIIALKDSVDNLSERVLYLERREQRDQENNRNEP